MLALVIMKKLSKTNFKWLGIFIASLTISITILSLDLSAFFHPEAAVLIIGGTSSYTLIANRDQPIAYRIGEGAVFFGARPANCLDTYCI